MDMQRSQPSRKAINKTSDSDKGAVRIHVLSLYIEGHEWRSVMSESGPLGTPSTGEASASVSSAAAVINTATLKESMIDACNISELLDAQMGDERLEFSEVVPEGIVEHRREGAQRSRGSEHQCPENWMPVFLSPNDAGTVGEVLEFLRIQI